jgi:hypothetical protein
MENEKYGGINPELAEASPWFREVMGNADELLSIGIDPATAAVIVAAVPVTLRVLKIASEFTSAMASDYAEKQRLKRKREELELERDFQGDGKGKI